MKSILASIALLLSLVVSTPALARASVLIDELPLYPAAAASGKSMTLDDVRRTIQTAALLKNWSLEERAPGAMLATFQVRGKHTIMVDITYTADGYTFAYNNSTNMNYKKENGLELIHPNYNKWVQDLRKAIQIELLKL